MEVDSIRASIWHGLGIFNSRPLMEVDSRLGRKFIIPRPFQLTTSRGGRPPKQICFLVCLRFSTHDLSWRSTSSIVSITQTVFFQLTTSRGGRQWRKIKMETKIFFQLTTSRGDRPYAYCVAVLSDFFNSRPLVEVDIQ